jgi:hypothetical protein
MWWITVPVTLLGGAIGYHQRSDAWGFLTGAILGMLVASRLVTALHRPAQSN